MMNSSDFSLPKVTGIEISVDGRTVTGAYSLVLGNLVVYYNGRTSSVRKPETNMHETAIEMLQDLVRQNYIEISKVPPELPEPIRIAAAEYVNSFDDDEPIRELIKAFGQATINSHVHTQISRLCINALQPIVPCWKAICDDDAAQQMLAELQRWLNDRSYPINWETARRPLVARRDGIKIVDCDACRVEPIATALAHCADYLQTANTDSAVKVILEAWGAHAEGCWPEDEDRSYEQWFIEVALPNAYHCGSSPPTNLPSL
jgi:hypothetical protein